MHTSPIEGDSTGRDALSSFVILSLLFGGSISTLSNPQQTFRRTAGYCRASITGLPAHRSNSIL